MKGIFIQLNPTKIHFWKRNPKGFNKWMIYFDLARPLSVVVVVVVMVMVMVMMMMMRLMPNCTPVRKFGNCYLTRRRVAQDLDLRYRWLCSRCLLFTLHRYLSLLGLKGVLQVYKNSLLQHCAFSSGRIVVYREERSWTWSWVGQLCEKVVSLSTDSWVKIVWRFSVIGLQWRRWWTIRLQKNNELFE